jgi:CheY-like chemotaxis protein
MLELNAKEPLSNNQESCVSHILKGGSHLLELIDQVLELNEIEAQRLSLNFDHVSLREIIDESLHLISARAQDEGIEIVDQTSTDELPLLWTDSTRLTQVLLNLLSNAVKYNRKGGSVTLTCEDIPAQMLRISVIDTGTGIPVGEQSNLFTPFERLGRESGEIEGTGIGLTITRQIIELLGGQVGYISDETGSTFWIDVSTAKKDEGTKQQGSSTDKPALVSKLNTVDDFVHTILYIEDNPENMSLMETIIGQLTNTKMLTAYNAELGIDLAKRNRPDLILMDLNLPGINGIEALKQLRKKAQTRDIPVIAITAAAMPKDIEKGIKAGFREYITKPIDISNMLQVIEETIDSAQSVA